MAELMLGSWSRDVPPTRNRSSPSTRSRSASYYCWEKASIGAIVSALFHWFILHFCRGLFECRFQFSINVGTRARTKYLFTSSEFIKTFAYRKEIAGTPSSSHPLQWVRLTPHPGQAKRIISFDHTTCKSRIQCWLDMLQSAHMKELTPTSEKYRRADCEACCSLPHPTPRSHKEHCMCGVHGNRRRRCSVWE